VLNLAAETDPTWVERALEQLDELLLDHAHCERKAAGLAIRLMFRYPDIGYLHEPLSRLAREELAHYEEVMRMIDSRGGALRRQKPSAYAGRLTQAIRGHEPERLVDTLVVAAVIEARSCERFKLLASAVADPTLAKLYSGLLACEARHHNIYLDLAVRAGGERAARDRLREFAALEADILSTPGPSVRMHS
jgi:tRNA-(ms[2]io[6]A)-hydroxylase